METVEAETLKALPPAQSDPPKTSWDRQLVAPGDAFTIKGIPYRQTYLILDLNDPGWVRPLHPSLQQTVNEHWQDEHVPALRHCVQIDDIYELGHRPSCLLRLLG